MSLKVFNGDEQVFFSEGSWLYPIFELEDYLSSHPELKAENLYAVDTKIGLAAAVLFFRLGFEKVHGDLMSLLAADFLKSKNISFTFNESVPKITCKTEDLITPDMNLDEVYSLLAKLAGRL